jgi:hypothetical protein
MAGGVGTGGSGTGRGADPAFGIMEPEKNPAPAARREPWPGDAIVPEPVVDDRRGGATRNKGLGGRDHSIRPLTKGGGTAPAAGMSDDESLMLPS